MSSVRPKTGCPVCGIPVRRGKGGVAFCTCGYSAKPKKRKKSVRPTPPKPETWKNRLTGIFKSRW